MRRNENRGDNVSAYYAEAIHSKWIMDTCANLIQVRDCLGNAAMFSTLTKMKNTDAKSQKSTNRAFVFKDANAAFEYSCKFLENDLCEGALLPAVVLDSRKLFGTEDPVRYQDDGNQIAALRVASDDGGFVVLATTAGPKGPRLEPDQLVAWQATKYLADLVEANKDDRFGWVGLILGTLKPEHKVNGWVGDQVFGQ